MRTQWAAVAACWIFSGAAFGSEAGADRLTVRILDSAGLPKETLRKAASQAQEVFHRAGIKTDWQICLAGKQKTCGQPIGDTDLILRIVPQLAIKGSSAFGSALLPNDGERSVYASVYYRRVEDAARRADCDPSLWLAYVMAHEAGHLLGAEHAPQGIMRPALGGSDLKRAAIGLLMFSDAEASQLQNGVVSRLQGGPSSGLVLQAGLTGR